MGLSDNPSDRVFNALLYSAGVIVIAIIMVGSIFLIYNSFSISLNERMRQIGILSSVGATSKQLRNSVPVSYTHLDVYKRQLLTGSSFVAFVLCRLSRPSGRVRVTPHMRLINVWD